MCNNSYYLKTLYIINLKLLVMLKDTLIYCPSIARPNTFVTGFFIRNLDNNDALDTSSLLIHITITAAAANDFSE